MTRYCFTGKGPRERQDYVALLHQLGHHSSSSVGRDVDVLVASTAAIGKRTKKTLDAIAFGIDVINYEEMESRIRTMQAQRASDPPTLYFAAGRPVIGEHGLFRIVKYGERYRVDDAPVHAPGRWREHRVFNTLTEARNEIARMQRAEDERINRIEANRNLRARQEMAGAHINLSGVTTAAQAAAQALSALRDGIERFEARLPEPEPRDPYKQRRVIDI